ncbi:MAG TPA: hypothetical protein VHK47_21380 [Polyangia bacterium]|jgi:hypothetical protein|nr:hypothetical protein [Polyangia bacterium]
MRSRTFALVVLTLACGAAACGSSGSSASSDGGGDAQVSSSLLAPVLDTLKPVPADAGMPGLHVGWTNQTAGCDAVEGWRKDALAPYAIVFTEPGTARSHDDFTATQNVNYTYRLRCKKGGAVSEYSSELSANPQGG